jgi:hypothetical protein
MTLKSHQDFSVDIGQDGAIKVRPGDWLSKYFACILQRSVGNADIPRLKKEFEFRTSQVVEPTLNLLG